MMDNGNNYEDFYSEEGPNPQGTPKEYYITHENEVSPQTNEEEDDNPINENTEYNDITSTRRGPGRPRFERTGLRGRPRKLYNEITVNDDNETNLIEDGFVCATELKIDDVMKDTNANEWL